MLKQSRENYTRKRLVTSASVQFKKKYDFWLTPKNSTENDFMSIDTNFNIDKDLFSDSIRDILKIRYFNKLKEFAIHLYRNNLYLNTRSCKWDNDRDNLCLNCRNELETKIHLFQTCSTTKDLLAFLERILKRVGHLQKGTAKYLFLYEGYSANSMENLLLIFLMRFIYGCKLNNVPVNKITFAYSYRWFNYMVANLSQIGLEKATKIIRILNID